MFKIDKKVIIILVLFVLNIVLLFKSNNSKTVYQNKLTKCSNTLQTKNMLIDNISKVSFLTEKFLSNTDIISPVINSKKNKTSCLDLCEDQITFFFRFSDEACSSCIIGELARLTKIKGIKTICLVTANNPNNIQQMDFLINSGLDYYYISDRIGLTGFEQENYIPFVFVIKNDILHSLLIPIKEEPSLSEQFYKYYDETLIEGFNKEI